MPSPHKVPRRNLALLAAPDGLKNLKVGDLEKRPRGEGLRVSGKKAELILAELERPEKCAEALGKSMLHGLLPRWEDAKPIVKMATSILAYEQTLEEVRIPPGGHLNVIGDVHGQYFDVLGIFEQFGYPSEKNPYLFNGDFVDKGSYSVEVMLLLAAWKVAYPSHVRLGRGNHEDHQCNVYNGFAGEVLMKYGQEAYEDFRRLFMYLPLAHVVNGDVLVVHGGLPRTAISLDDIRSLNRVGEYGKSELISDLTWSDPRDTLGHSCGQRGGGFWSFGPDVTEEFLRANGLKLLIRSHEVQDEGFLWQHNGKCLTVFSAPNYCDSEGNKGAVVRLTVQEDGSLQEPVSITTFTAKPRPTTYVPPRAYAWQYDRRRLTPEVDEQLSVLCFDRS